MYRDYNWTVFQNDPEMSRGTPIAKFVLEEDALRFAALMRKAFPGLFFPVEGESSLN